nr:pseudouridine synthase [uncultured Blautia sp.]
MKQLTLTVDESMEGQTLDQVLKAGLGLTRKQISQAKFRSGGIIMDGAQVRTTYVCRTGQELRVCVEEDREDTGRVMPGAGVLDILYEDSLGSRLAAYFTEKGEQTLVRPKGRLDRDTSGIMVYAKNQIAAARLSLQKQDGSFQKEYLAFVEGYFHTKTGRSRSQSEKCRKRSSRCVWMKRKGLCSKIPFLQDLVFMQSECLSGSPIQEKPLCWRTDRSTGFWKISRKKD